MAPPRKSLSPFREGNGAARGNDLFVVLCGVGFVSGLEPRGLGRYRVWVGLGFRVLRGLGLRV